MLVFYSFLSFCLVFSQLFCAGWAFSDFSCLAPVEGLSEAIEYRGFFFEPGGHTGHLAGVFPLEPLLFFDGTNLDHIEWAQRQESAKWVLVAGNPIEVEERTGRTVFFDQMGVLSRQFGIEKVPSKVSQQGGKILVEEIPIGRG